MSFPSKGAFKPVLFVSFNCFILFLRILHEKFVQYSPTSHCNNVDKERNLISTRASVLNPIVCFVSMLV